LHRGLTLLQHHPDLYRITVSQISRVIFYTFFKLIPVRVAACTLTDMLVSIVYIDLVGLSKPDAKRAFIDGLKHSRRLAQPAVSW
jgi:hypothetical protein